MKLLVMLIGFLVVMIYAIQPILAADQTSSIIVNQQVCHILEDSPSCSGIAPQKTQNADVTSNSSISMKDNNNLLQSSKTNIEFQRTLRELSGRVKRD